MQGLVKNMKERDQLQNMGLNEKMVLKYMLNKLGGRGLD